MFSMSCLRFLLTHDTEPDDTELAAWDENISTTFVQNTENLLKNDHKVTLVFYNKNGDIVHVNTEGTFKNQGALFQLSCANLCD